MPIIDSWPELPAPATTVQGLAFIFDILPDDFLALSRQLWTPRLKVNGTEVQIQNEATVNEGDTEIGETVTVTLLKPSDESLFTSSASLDFGVGRKLSGVWDDATFETLLEDAQVESVDRSIVGPPNNPQDRVKVTIISKAGARLSKTSATGLIIYDSNRGSLSEADIKPLKDASGNSYSPQIIAVPGLTLGYLFNEIFVTRCGFNSPVHTDLPVFDWPISRYQVRMGERFYDGLKADIGVYNPAMKIIGDDIWLTDTTIVQPTGFPAPRQITLDRPLSIQTGSKRQRLDAYKISYSGLENNYDFTTPKFDNYESTNGAITRQGQKITIEFRKITSPTTNVIVRSQLNIENKQTFFGIDQTDDSSEVYEFDNKGRISTHRNIVEKLLPSGSTVYDTASLQKESSVTEDYVYQAHPFKAQTDFVARRTAQTTGLLARIQSSIIAIGNQALPMAATTAARSGFLTTETSVTDVTYEEAPTRFREETAEPLRNGEVRVKTFEVDQLTGLVLVDTSEDRPGEIGIAARVTSTEELLVYAVAGGSRTAERVEELNIRELPLKYGIPLARRKLLQRQADAGTFSIPVLGYDRALAKGFPISLYDRDSTEIGAFVITGRVITINARGLVMTLTGRVMAATAQTLQEVERYTTTIEESGVWTGTISIGCTTGYSLFLAPTSVANLTIEARHVEMPALGWTNLETDSISLTAFDGTNQDFEIRVTAGAVAVETFEEFSLIVDFTDAP